jgi:hypothetical protein
LAALVPFTTAFAIFPTQNECIFTGGGEVMRVGGMIMTKGLKEGRWWS